ncbi:hypothetical protein KR067_001284, partial [Drosophila pandora]
FMRPIYHGCMEKGIQHVATHATEMAVGGGGAAGYRSQTSVNAANGKVKRS